MTVKDRLHDELDDYLDLGVPITITVHWNGKNEFKIESAMKNQSIKTIIRKINENSNKTFSDNVADHLMKITQ